MSFICFFKINSISLNCQYFYVLKNGIISFLAPKLKKKIKNYETIRKSIPINDCFYLFLY